MCLEGGGVGELGHASGKERNGPSCACRKDTVISTFPSSHLPDQRLKASISRDGLSRWPASCKQTAPLFGLQGPAVPVIASHSQQAVRASKAASVRTDTLTMSPSRRPRSHWAPREAVDVNRSSRCVPRGARWALPNHRQPREAVNVCRRRNACWAGSIPWHSKGVAGHAGRMRALHREARPAELCT